MEAAESAPQNPRDAFRAAFDAAVLTHSTPAATAAAAATETDDDDPEPAAAATPAATPATAKPAATTVETPATPAAEAGLITDEEFAALQTTHANDPAALRKSLEGAFTKKTQALAAERTTYERVKEYVPLIEAYEADPQATLAHLAAQHGLTLVPKGAAATPAAAETTPATTVTDAATPAPKPVDFDYNMDEWAAAYTEWSEARAQARAQAEVAPLRASLEKETRASLEKEAAETTATVMTAFTAAHPDWQTHEAAIVALAQKVVPHGMTELEFLEHLYTTVTGQAQLAALKASREADIEREVNGRFKTRIAKMNTGTAEATPETVPESQVHKRPPGPVSFDQAFQDARRGIRYED